MENIFFCDFVILCLHSSFFLEDMNFEVKRNQNVMITGPNGAGKSSLFRIIGELWPPHAALSSQERAKIIKPKKRDILFVPQKPYLVLGTLRDQIIYPHSKADMEVSTPSFLALSVRSSSGSFAGFCQLFSAGSEFLHFSNVLGRPSFRFFGRMWLAQVCEFSVSKINFFVLASRCYRCRFTKFIEDC
jgi:hypothetical protein